MLQLFSYVVVDCDLLISYFILYLLQLMTDEYEFSMVVNGSD